MNIRWGSYKGFEGPWYPGNQSFSLPDSPTFAEEVLAVITATEGGHWDAINRYDSCIDTQGLIQWCNRAPQRSVDGLYEALHAHDPDLLSPVKQFFADRQFSFNKGCWYQGAAQIDTPSEQHRLYFLNASGMSGSWDDSSKDYAKRALEAAVAVWQSSEARRIQAEWTIKRLNWFLVSDEVKQAFKEAPDNSFGRAFKAMYWSFAANNPMKAAAAFMRFQEEEGHLVQPWTSAWLVESSYYLTFDPGITIYPHRYNKIRPVLERLYGVDLPDYADTLKKQFGQVSSKVFLDPAELQRALLALGYDLGPRGADGVAGNKTKEALRAFERDMGVDHPDGEVDVDTSRLLETALERRGIQELT